MYIARCVERIRIEPIGRNAGTVAKIVALWQKGLPTVN